MTIQDDEGFEGVEVETPVGTFRAGRGRSGWAGEDDFRSVRQYVRRRIGFYRLVWLALWAFGLVLIVDVATGWDGWSLWVGAVLGILLALRFLTLFVFDSLLGREAERRMIEAELRKREGRRH
ncbi:MAG TPA: 2TM domain-containing protein [Dehalococcoidia bacterium]|jgi:hypothetical protein|nr:2TM domain-containing protein [Dehalococcoidia bacterium]